MQKIITLNNGTSVYEMYFFTKVASYIYCTCVLNMNSDKGRINFSDIEEQFNLPKGFIDDEMAERIRDALFREFENQVVSCRISNSQDGEIKFQGYFVVDIDRYYIPNWNNY